MMEYSSRGHHQVRQQAHVHDFHGDGDFSSSRSGMRRGAPQFERPSLLAYHRPMAVKYAPKPMPPPPVRKSSAMHQRSRPSRMSTELLEDFPAHALDDDDDDGIQSEDYYDLTSMDGGSSSDGRSPVRPGQQQALDMEMNHEDEGYGDGTGPGPDGSAGPDAIALLAMPDPVDVPLLQVLVVEPVDVAPVVPPSDSGSADGDGDAYAEGEAADTVASELASTSSPLYGDADHVHEADVIHCDPAKLPRVSVMDEDGFEVTDRASLMNSAYSAGGYGRDSDMSMRSTGSYGYRGYSSIINPLSQSLPPSMPGNLSAHPGTVIKSGLLFKQGFAFMNGGWKVRHVVLTSASLAFYREASSTRKRGEIKLAQCSAKCIEIMPKDSVFDGAQATMWRFGITVKGRRVLLAAYTEVEMKEWLRCLHVAMSVQGSGVGRFTDLVVRNGTLLADKGDGLMRSSGSRLLR